MKTMFALNVAFVAVILSIGCGRLVAPELLDRIGLDEKASRTVVGGVAIGCILDLATLIIAGIYLC